MSYLDGITFYGQRSIQDQILHNVVQYFDYGLLEKGAYINVTKGKTDRYNNDLSLLVSSDQKIYRGSRPNWVWETGVNIAPGVTAPISISGIYVNNTFHANGTSGVGNGFHIDYLNGRIIFNNTIAKSSVVQVEHSAKYVNVALANTERYRNIVSTFQNFNNQALKGSGTDYSPGNYAYLPSMFIGISNLTSTPMQIGDRSKFVNATLSIDIFAENVSDKTKLSDFVYMSEEKSVFSYDVNTAPMPLTASGTLITNPKTYPTLIEEYKRRPNDMIRFNGDTVVRNEDSMHLPVQYAKVRITVETPA